MRKISLWCAVVALIALPAAAGEWHAAATNLCTDCHTMHFSQTHNWDGTTPVSTTPAADGNWLSTTGPNHYLLKAPANQLCLSCHDGQTFAPDVVGINTNPSPTQGRSGGALNDVAGAAPYETWKGHTLDSTEVPPGYDPSKIGLSPTFYTPANGLECINCHLQHGNVIAYRNLGPRSGPGGYIDYTISTTNDPTKDVWINMAGPYTANTGNALTFNPFYSTGNIFYNRNDATVGVTKTSNQMDTFCAACHGNFHGGPADSSIGGVGTPAEEFIRHPTSQVSIGALGGGHSQLARFVAATSKVKVYTTDYVGYTNTSPGCVSCHKAHGNQNPFGLVFLSRFATAPGEEGGRGPTDPIEAPNGYQVGYRNLCGQCHGQGN
jgi:cytochrome c553